METVGRLAGGIAHDMNNLLTAIIGHASLAGAETAEPSVAQSVAIIKQAAERAAGLTQQLLAFSRRQVLQPTVVDVNRVVKDVEPILSRLISEQIEVVVATTPGAGSVLVDRTQLEQVVLNLTVNARDAMAGGGRLVLSTNTAVVDRDPPHVDMTPGPYVVLSVADTGIGMDEATQAKIFEPFFTTKPVGQGTGLGLSTVYGIVRQSGGHILVYSEPGLGTTFRIYLPRVEGDPLDEPASLAITGRSHGRVLLVEDEGVLRALALRVLERDGFEVLVAATPDEALALAAGATTIDLVLSDVIMPGLTGVALAGRLREARPGLPVVLMSGYAEDVADAHSVAQAFLAKPFTPETMIQAVRRVLADARDAATRWGP
jgi:CheY-like chemotaxis protein